MCCVHVYALHVGMSLRVFICYFRCICPHVPVCPSAGPLGTALCNAYDAQRVVMAGGFLASLGLILASQARSLPHLYLTMGLTSGTSTHNAHCFEGLTMVPRRRNATTA